MEKIIPSHPKKPQTKYTYSLISTGRANTLNRSRSQFPGNLPEHPIREMALVTAEQLPLDSMTIAIADS